jgi:hypothetical protein
VSKCLSLIQCVAIEVWLSAGLDERIKFNYEWPLVIMVFCGQKFYVVGAQKVFQKCQKIQRL